MLITYYNSHVKNVDWVYQTNLSTAHPIFKLPETAKSAATCSLPRGGGLGRGHSPNCSNLSNTFTTQIQALWLVALSLTLSHGREDGRLL